MYRSETVVKDLKGSGNKSAYTSIYYLLSGKDFSAYQTRKGHEIKTLISLNPF